MLVVLEPVVILAPELWPWRTVLLSPHRMLNTWRALLTPACDTETRAVT